MGRPAHPQHVGRPQRIRAKREEIALDRELADLPGPARWREWMLRIEAVIFASTEPVGEDTLARLVGEGASVARLIEDLRIELRERPYDIVPVADGWQHRTRIAYAGAVRAARAPTRGPGAALSEKDAAVLLAIAYFQPVTRGELSKIFGREISRDLIAGLRQDDLIASGPRSPTPGAPYTYVTTKRFLSSFGLNSLNDLPDVEMLEDAGLLKRDGDAGPGDFGEDEEE